MMKMLLPILLSFSALAAVTDEPPIPKGQMVRIKDFDRASQTFEVVMIDYSAQGPNFALLKDLCKAIQSLDCAKAKRKPEAIVNNEYHLDETLALQSVVKTLAKRKGKRP